MTYAGGGDNITPPLLIKEQRDISPPSLFNHLEMLPNIPSFLSSS